MLFKNTSLIKTSIINDNATEITDHISSFYLPCTTGKIGIKNYNSLFEFFFKHCFLFKILMNIHIMYTK